MTYRELQTALKAFRSQGYDVQVKLTASFDTLQAEYNRLSTITSLSYANAQPASPEPPQEQPRQEPEQSQEQIVVEPENSFRVDWIYPVNLPKNEPYSQQENSQSFVEQGSEYIQSEPRGQYQQTDFESLESLHSKALAITIVDNSNSPYWIDITELGQTREPGVDNTRENTQETIQAIAPSQQSSYWIDGTELGQNLNQTQAQALRNLEDGINWLVKLPGRLKAFESGFREGLKKVDRLRQTQPSQPQVIPIHSKRRQPVPMAA